MDLNKLKLNKFNNIQIVNFNKYDLDINSVNNEVEVIIYYLGKIEDVEDFVDLVRNTNLPEDNRTIMVYEKGRKDINRDSIMMPFKNKQYLDFKLKAPMMCSLSKELTAVVLCKVV